MEVPQFLVLIMKVYMSSFPGEVMALLDPILLVIPPQAAH